MTMKPLIIQEIDDKWVRENFRRIQDFVRLETLFKGKWRFMEIAVAGPVASRDYAHNLGFQPKDVIQLALTQGVTWTWHFASFSPTTLRFTTDAAATIRCFVGRYEENV